MHRAGPPQLHQDTRLIESLQKNGAFRHPVDNVDLIETHVSWLILAGDFAYKVKKPIKLDFLDFSSLERRRFFCEEELRLNRPWAPDIYLDVVPIVLAGDQPMFGGTGDAIDYAVRMRRFDQALRLDHQLDAGELSVADMKELAVNIASRHEAVDAAEVSERARVLRLTQELMEDNFRELEGCIEEGNLKPLRQWTEREFAKVRPLLEQRFDDGFVRDCHGDLHLGNLVRLPGGITTFDCIEFNSDLRRIDVMCDIAFLVMDLAARERVDLAAHFLNRYLEVTGDYSGVGALNLFFVYRCLVRAKVAAIMSLERTESAEKVNDLRDARFYCSLASRQIAERQPLLVVMHGFSGSGKTWVSGELMAALPAVRLRSDVERKRLFDLAETGKSQSAVGKGIYDEDANRKSYGHLFDLARQILGSGHSVILDAAFLESGYRSGAIAVAEECNCPIVIVDVVADRERMRRRLQERGRESTDASEADVSVLTYQQSIADSLTSSERRLTIECDNSRDIDVTQLISRIRKCN
jgi:aminoglycoside phosphotransferase family enzyme